MMKRLSALLLAAMALSPLFAQQQKTEGVEVRIPTGATDQQVIELATQVRPSYRQLDYQQREMVGFIHIGMNTFTKVEWGTGTEDPKIFNPSELNADKWISTFKKGGVSAVILVAKHHDGFCTWPSKFTEHSVANSPWRGGNGDLVKEVADACKKHDIKLCIYLSPWDMHEKTYGTYAYNDYYINQLEELLTNYGPIYLLWFDGAGVGSNVSGKEMPFDWQRIFTRARELQPDILLSGAAPDIRWVGNEAGRGRETEWSVQGVDEDIQLFGGDVKGINLTAKNLGSIEDIKSSKRLVWYPSRGGLPFRKGWFYHPNDDNTTKSLTYLVNSYFSTVGQNSNLLPNLSPNDLGIIPEKDANRLIDFGNIIAKMKANDYAKGATIKPLTAWEIENADALNDEDPFTSWHTKEGTTTGSFEVKLTTPQLFNVIKLQENIRDFGQRVEAFAIDAFIDGAWTEVAKSTTIGLRKMVRLEQPIHTDLLRVRILDARVSISIGNISLYYLAPFAEEDNQASKPIYFNKQNITVKSNGLKLNKKDLKNIVDGDNSTVLTAQVGTKKASFTFDLGKEEQLKGFSYLPVDNQKSGHIEQYALYTSVDGKNWNCIVAPTRFGNIQNNPVEQVVTLEAGAARFVKLDILNTTKKSISLAEFNFF